MGEQTKILNHRRKPHIEETNELIHKDISILLKCKSKNDC